MNTKVTTISKCIYCHVPLIETNKPSYPFYCSDVCKEETSIALKDFFDALGSDLGTGG